MKNKKSFVIGISSLLLGVLLVLAIHGKQTMALFTDQSNLINSGTAGKVQVDVKETVEGFSKKNIYMKNTGESDCYVRMRVEYPKIAELDGYNSARREFLEVVPGVGDKWTKNNSDGYFYYNDVLPSEGETEKLYNSISYNFDQDENGAAILPDGVSKDQLQIIVYGEAVQSAYIADDYEPGTTYVNVADYAFHQLKKNTQN